MIEFKNVSASYDGELAVLRDVSFTVNDGDFVAFVGTNGAGKSTTMRLVNGLLKPTAGEVLIDGVPTGALKTSTSPAHRLPLPEPRPADLLRHGARGAALRLSRPGRGGT